MWSGRGDYNNEKHLKMFMKIVKQFWNTTMCGVYFKILQTGNVQVGDTFEPIKKCSENPTIADLYIAKRVSKGM